MRYQALPLLVALAVSAGCTSDPAGPRSDPTPSFSLGGSPIVLTLVDENNAALATQSVVSKYRCGGSWTPDEAYTTDVNGEFTVTPSCPLGNWDDKVTVTLNQKSKEQTVTTDPIYQAARVDATLKSCTAPIVVSPGGLLEQGGGYWHTHGNTGPTGTVSFHTFPGTVKLKMSYNNNSATLENIPVIAGTNQVDFLTTKVTLIHAEDIRSNKGGSWWAFVKPSMDLLPGDYGFQFKNGATWGSTVTLTVSGCEFVYPAAEDNDDEPPVLTNVVVSPNPAPYTTTSYLLTADASDNVAVTAAWYTINGGTEVPFSVTSGANVALSAALGPLDVGVYDICVTAEDGAGNISSAECTMLAVYDPNAGFVTGGGWINSPPEAYVPDASLTGKATFGFVSKYQKGKTTPTGNTQFQFKAGDLNFSSTSYEWLVVSGARAQFKGAGTINGGGDYRFMLTAIDGQISGGDGTDKFRIRIWDNDDGGLVYDNQLNAPDSDDPTTVIGGGSIVIHVPKK
ncbi:MAG: hypothetical protein ABR551_08445 [Gemmatimonadales bacterium]